MMAREQEILYVCWSIFVLVVFIAALLVRRHGHTSETKAILDAIEGGRRQTDVLNGTVEGEMRSIKTSLGELKDRFGFLRRHK